MRWLRTDRRCQQGLLSAVLAASPAPGPGPGPRRRPGAGPAPGALPAAVLLRHAPHPPAGPAAGQAGTTTAPPQPEPAKQRPRLAGWVQLRLPVDVRRDYARFDRDLHTDLANPPWCRPATPPAPSARPTAGATGWPRRSTAPWSSRGPATPPATRSACRSWQRCCAAAGWLDRRLHGMPPGIRRDVERGTPSRASRPSPRAGRRSGPGRPEPGDLVGRVVHPGLAQDTTAGVVHHRVPARRGLVELVTVG
jgi:hypothetical protein